jgi:hypothetical protein
MKRLRMWNFILFIAVLMLFTSGIADAKALREEKASTNNGLDGFWDVYLDNGDSFQMEIEMAYPGQGQIYVDDENFIAGVVVGRRIGIVFMNPETGGWRLMLGYALPGDFLILGLWGPWYYEDDSALDDEPEMGFWLSVPAREVPEVE